MMHVTNPGQTLVLLVLAGCASVAESRIDDRVAPSPAAQIRETVRPPAPPSTDPALLAQLSKGGTVSLAQLIDFALRTSPATRATWADARAAAAALGSKNSTYWPELDVQGGWELKHQVFSPTATIAYKDCSTSAGAAPIPTRRARCSPPPT